MQNNRWLCCVLLASLGLVGLTSCETFPVGDFCAEDPVAPFDVQISIREGTDQIVVEITDPLIPLDSHCLVQLNADSSRLVGTCEDTGIPCNACGLSIDIIDDSVIYIDYALGSVGATRSSLTTIARLCQ